VLKTRLVFYASCIWDNPTPSTVQGVFIFLRPTVFVLKLYFKQRNWEILPKIEHLLAWLQHDSHVKNTSKASGCNVALEIPRLQWRVKSRKIPMITGHQWDFQDPKMEVR
jgi:hypothetical protein